MTKFRDSIVEYNGEGELICDGKTTPIKFKCQQLFDGHIIGDIKLLEEDHSKFLGNLKPPLKIYGSTSDGLAISIESLYLTRYSDQSSEEKYYINDIKFQANNIEARVRSLSSDNREIMIYFGVANFRAFRTKVDTNIGKLGFINYKGYEDVIEDINSYNKSCITGFASLVFKPEIRASCAEEYLKLAQKEIDKVLILTSFSQGICQSWNFAQVCEKIDEKNYEKIYFYFRTTKEKSMGFRPVTYHLDLTNYLAVTYPNYTDKTEEKTGMQYAIEWYLESLASDIIESKYIMAFTCLELLVDRYESEIGDEILDKKLFEELKDKIQEVCRSFLKEKGISTEKRKSFYKNLTGLNRYPFTEQLKKILVEYKIGYTDIFKELSEITKIRDEIVHKGMSSVDFGTLINNYNRLMAMNQRIILSILNYDGHSYIDWINNEGKEFDRDPNGEYKD